MLIKRFFFHFVILLFVLMVMEDLYAVVSSPRIHTLTQPDGNKFYAKQWGDEWLNGWQTLDGYTIVKDETGFWVYAKKDTSGRLIPTTIRANESPPSGFQINLRPSVNIRRETAVKSRRAPNYVVPPTGTANIPVILINFNDTTTTYSVSDFNSLLFGNAPSIATGPGSMKDYYEDVSYGLFSISSGPSGVSGWQTATNGHDYYGYSQGFTRAATLAREAVLAADAAGFNFSQYDSDSDGKVDVVAIVHQGRGTEESGNSTDIWSHQWSLSDAGVGTVTADGKTVDNYIIMPEKLDSASISTIGVFAHEYGHALGLPDLYDTDYSSEGIGEWGLMGSGSWNYTVNLGDTPAHMMAWSKWYLGWLTPTQITGSLNNQSISAVENTPVAYYCPANTSGVDWVFDTSSGTGEYFLIENRQQTGFDAGLPGSGLAVWHIAENAPYDNTANENEYGVRLVDLKEADGDDDLDNGTNRGDSGDLFPGSSNNTSFYAGTTPAAKFYDGSDSSLIVTGISPSGLTMTASLECGSDVSLVIDSTTVDDSSANNNGYADPGEDVLLNITLKDVRGTTTGISGVLSTTDPYITIISNTSSYPNLAYNGSGDSITPYQLRVSASTPNFRNVSLSLAINANSGTYSVTRNFSIYVLGGTSGILFVDDDGGDSYETAYKDALSANGYSYVTWDTSSLLSPPVGKMSPQPSSVIWFTGDAISDTLTSTDQTNLAEYLDGGGTLFLSSQGVLSELDWGVDTFTTEYLKVASGSSNIVLGTASVQGVSNDPITNGLNLTLTRTLTGDVYYYSVPNPDIQDLADEVRPDLTVATNIFTNPANNDLPSALRYPTSGSTTYKIVFLAFPFEAIDNSSGARNTLMQKIIEWLRPDTTPPAQVTSLSGTTGSKEGEVTLTWTAPGDDGTSGTAASYVIRRNTVSITSSNWASSSDVSGEPTPSAAGTTETVTLNGLPAGQNYYFALKAMDEEENASPVSNNVRVTVQNDMTAPASTSDLTAALGSNPGEVILSWTAPGDDVNEGKSASYDVRYLAGSAISASNWATATEITSGEPTPAVAGSSESMTVSGMTDNTTYYFALKSKDNADNTSNISNSPSISMPDTTPPSGSAISNFTATAGDGQVTLQWTWESQTDASGLIIVVDMSTSPQTLNQGLQIDSVLKPNASYTHSGLTNGKTYYYSVFAFDESGNFSSAITTSGVTPTASSGSGGGGGGCFIATAAYGTPMCDEVKSLCGFRDRYLMANLPGRLFVKTYYKLSPPVARFISEREYLKKFVRAALKPIISFAASIQ